MSDLRWRRPDHRIQPVKRRRRWPLFAAGGAAVLALMVLGVALAMIVRPPETERAVSSKSFNLGTPTATPDPDDPEASIAPPAIVAAATTGVGPALRPGEHPLVAFVRDGDIVVYNVATGAERQLTRDGANTLPRLSADGQWVSYTKDGGEVWTSLVDGSRARRMPGRFAWWSPATGQQVVLTLSGGLWLVNADGSRGRQIAVDESGVRAVLWHPTGTKLAFQTFVNDASATNLVRLDTWLVDITSGNVARVPVVTSGTSTLNGPRLAGWAADGKSLLMLLSRQTAVGTVWALTEVAPDGQQGRRLLDLVVNFSIGGSASLAVPLVGAVRPELGSTQFSLVQVERASGEATTISGPEPLASLWPSYSPGGRLAWARAVVDPQVAMVQGRGLVVREASGETRAITPGERWFDETPIWLGDDDLLFVRRPAGGSAPTADLMHVRLGEFERVVATGLATPGGTSGFGRTDWDAFVSVYVPRSP